MNITNTTLLEAMFMDMAPGAHTIICGFHGDPNTADRIQSARNWCGRPWTPGTRAPYWFNGCNSYMTVSEFLPDDNGEQRRRKSEFLQYRAVPFDDVGDGLGSKVPFSKLMLPPSYLVETSPRNYQALYFLTDHNEARDFDTCDRLIKRLIGAGLTQDSKDPGQAGVTRYGRLPRGLNMKKKYIEKLGHPFQVRCELFEPTRRYTIPEIAAAWKLDMTPPTPRPPLSPLTPEQAARAMASFDGVLAALETLGMYTGARNGAWHHVTCPWIDTHTDRGDSGSALCEPNAANNFTAGYKCWHGHCSGDGGGAKRTYSDIRAWLRALPTMPIRAQPSEVRA